MGECWQNSLLTLPYGEGILQPVAEECMPTAMHINSFYSWRSFRSKTKSKLSDQVVVWVWVFAIVSSCVSWWACLLVIYLLIYPLSCHWVLLLVIICGLWLALQAPSAAAAEVCSLNSLVESCRSHRSLVSTSWLWFLSCLVNTEFIPSSASAMSSTRLVYVMWLRGRHLHSSLALWICWTTEH